MVDVFYVAGVKIVIVDFDGVEEVVKVYDGFGMCVDVMYEMQIVEFVKQMEVVFGMIDIYVFNVGILCIDEFSWDVAGVMDQVWCDSFEVNVMGVVYGVCQVWLGMKEKGLGVFILVVFVVGLLGQIGVFFYIVIKYVVVFFVESLFIVYGDEGLQVVCVCLQVVWIDMFGGSEDGGIVGVDGIVEFEDVVVEIFKVIEEKCFLVLLYLQVVEYEVL